MTVVFYYLLSRSKQRTENNSFLVNMRVQKAKMRNNQAQAKNLLNENTSLIVCFKLK